MKGTKVATRYAAALLDLANENTKVEQVSGDMNYLLSANADSADFQLLLNSPIISADKKIAIFAELFDQFEDVTKSFIKMVTENGREQLLVEIASVYGELVRKQKGIVPVTITSAVALDAKTKDAIVAKVQGAVKGTLEVKEEIDTDLMGGFVVRMEDKRIDASVASQLNKLKQRLTR